MHGTAVPVPVHTKTPTMMLAEPTFSRSQSHYSQGTVSEYVEDSEPEREERRVRQKSSSTQPRINHRVKLDPEVIELSDSEESACAGLPTASVLKLKEKPCIIINVSDSSCGSSPRHKGRPSAIEGKKPENAIESIPSMFQDCTTDDSFPSIREIMNVPRSATSFKPQLTDAQAAAPSSKNSVFVELADRVLHELPEETEKSSDDEGHLKLGRFAYANPNPARRTMSKTPSPTERGSAPPTEGPTGSKSKRSITPTHRFTGDFSDAELSRILKCVSCELAWTARKTVPQKMKHIQSCAKKNGLNDETVRTLLRKELDNLSPVTSASKASTSAPTVTPVPETLLEDVLKDTSKKKPGRRPQVLQTVKSITETRETILEKARSLLQSSGSARPAFTVEHTSAGPWVAKYGDAPPATQVFSKSSICARVDPVEVAQADITHVFGPSRLAAQSSRLHGAVVRTGAHIAGHSDVSPLTQEAAGANATPSEVYLHTVEDIPPSTQVFAPSKLANADGASRRIATAAIDHTRLEEAMSIHDTDEDDFARSSPQRPPSPYSPTSPNGSLPGPSKPKNPTKDAHPIPASARSPLNRQTPSRAGDERYVGRSHQQPEFDVDSNEYDDYEWNQWMNDDVWDEEGGACLHYVPQTAGAGPSRLQGGSVAEEPPSLPRHRLAPILKDVLASAGTSVPASSSQPPTKKKRRKKAAASEESEAEAAKASDISQDELNVKMKEAILKDEALHLRILRYEPIHFDVFLQMAVNLGIPAKRSGLKGKVRAFLDQKAIHFYGADPSKSRTRRARHP